jgi:hypothetical protein
LSKNLKGDNEMRKSHTVLVIILTCLALVLPLYTCAAASAENGFVRLAVKGTNVNLRPQPRAGGGVIAQMSDGGFFFAEKWPITCQDDNSQWYKIVLPAPETGKIEPLCDWDSRFTTNVAFVNANFVEISQLRNNDLNRILATPVGGGYSLGEFGAMDKAGLIPFSPIYLAKERVEVFVDKPLNSESLAAVYYERGFIRVTGIDPEGAYYTVMDPSFRKPAGFVKVGAISAKHYDISEWDNNFNWSGFDATCRLSAGANLPEIVRNWGESEIERSSFEIMDDLYTIYTSVKQPDFQATFYEYPPKPGDPPDVSLTMPYLQTLSVKRSGARIGGIHIGRDDEGSVRKLLGEPHSKDKQDGEDVWNWHSEFNDLWVTFGRNGRVSSVSLQWRRAD